MKNALNKLLALTRRYVSLAMHGIGARGALNSDTIRPLDRRARRALLRQTKRLNRREFRRVA